MTASRILAFAGSLRSASLNRKLLAVAVDGARAAGAEVATIDLRDFPLPLYDGDLEAAEGLPAQVRSLKDLFKAHHGFLVASPEYNSSITAVLKNTIDWVSRPDGPESGRVPYEGKVAGLFSASPGPYGALRSLEVARSILMTLGCLVVPQRVALSRANQAFADDGTLKDPELAGTVRGVAGEVVHVLSKLRGDR
ncbi:MAG: NAD(P)H-dependent oxidoreductase [Betaproteobacteria bacterium]